MGMKKRTKMENSIQTLKPVCKTNPTPFCILIGVGDLSFQTIFLYLGVQATKQLQIPLFRFSRLYDLHC